MENYELVANLNAAHSVLAKMPLGAILGKIEQEEMSQQEAYETIHSFLNDLRALTSMCEAVFTLDTASVTHPHGMTEEIRKQRNNILSVARKLCRAEAISRWDGVLNRWENFVRAMDSLKT